MAYDKVVDSAVLDAGLKQIADAIREKGGTSDNLAFPTAMADAITAIEAGGGSGGGGGPFTAWGTYTPTENQNDLIIIDTGIAVGGHPAMIDYIILLWRNGGSKRVNGSYEIALGRKTTSGYCYTYGITPSGSVYYGNQSTVMVIKLDTANGNYVLKVNGKTDTGFVYGMVAGVEYTWAFIYPVG